MSEDDFLVLFNALAKKESKDRATSAPSLEESLVDLGLDSMDLLVMGLHFCTWWDISDIISKRLTPVSKTRVVKPETLNISNEMRSIEVSTIRDLYEFLETYKQKEPLSLQELLRCI